MYLSQFNLLRSNLLDFTVRCAVGDVDSAHSFYVRTIQIVDVSKVKGKGHPVQALRLCTGRTVHGGSRGIALPFHDHGSG